MDKYTKLLQINDLLKTQQTSLEFLSNSLLGEIVATSCNQLRHSCNLSGNSPLVKLWISPFRIYSIAYDVKPIDIKLWIQIMAQRTKFNVKTQNFNHAILWTPSSDLPSFMFKVSIIIDGTRSGYQTHCMPKIIYCFLSTISSRPILNNVVA